MQISYLMDQPAHIPVLAEWLHEEWGHLYPGATLETRNAELKLQMRREVPLTLVAHEDGEALGTAALIESDLPTRPNLRPWLASVYVSPHYRARGIGGALVQRVMEICRGLGYPEFYLWTEDRADFYEKLGWEPWFIEDYLEAQVTVMRYDFRGKI